MPSEIEISRIIQAWSVHTGRRMLLKTTYLLLQTIHALSLSLISLTGLTPMTLLFDRPISSRKWWLPQLAAS